MSLKREDFQYFGQLVPEFRTSVEQKVKQRMLWNFFDTAATRKSIFDCWFSTEIADFDVIAAFSAFPLL